ncbi:MAG: hypothetical protein JXA57_02615 [Armatimonadetes bacterium]|nr:hypothetical protein [Armatimonadota bacterium]
MRKPAADGRLLFPVFLVVFLLALLGRAGAATLLLPEGQGPGGQTLYAWEAHESWPGGEQDDPRLDAVVTCWRAAVSFPDLFADLTQQTGVSLDCWPPGDQNERVRVHVFLNPEEPPTLRELLVQLSWVTDCAFGCTGAGDTTRYYLLSTSIAQSAAADLEQSEAEKKQQCEDLVQSLKDTTAELEEALQLSRQEAIDLYHGRDDALLLTLLDPARRAAAQVVLRPENLPRLLDGIRFNPALPPGSHSFGSNINIAPLPEESREAIRTAFPDYDVDYDDPKAWCPLIVDSLGRVQLGSPRYHGDPPSNGLDGLVPVIDLSSDIDSRPKDEIALRRALEEHISPTEEEAYVAGREAVIALQQAAERESGGKSLSREMRDLLGGTVFSLPPGTHAVWTIEEEVARTAGLHIVSDGLLDAQAAVASRDSSVREVTALHALEEFCHAPGRNFTRSPEWEWRGAGRFLSFRTANRDVWRAAMLPETLLDWLDSQIQICLSPPTEDGEGISATEFDLPVEPEGWTYWIGSLSDLQLHYGALVPYGEPGDLCDAARRATWKAAFALAGENPPMMRFLGSLHASQWQAAYAGTLQCPTGLSPSQVELLEAAIDQRSNWNLHLPEDSAITISISQGAPESDVLWMHTTGAAGGGQTYPEEVAGSGKWYRVHLTATGSFETDGEEDTILEKQVPFLPTSIHVSVEAQGITPSL